ncbi:GNAT family N-acetyltransferase [Fusobacterium nucleatum]|uniref:GNAT family N-acetyltransferase n=1 Tax=Fusobacterium nucleatum TaxID=851 RepID=UPI00041BDB9A|nr:GNAT family N-acetyltransferase [Fusobacterium nucleatum]
MNIVHNKGNGFYIYDENKEILARLEYKRNGNVLDFEHTVVSDKLKGQGVAAKLLDEAVDYARKNNLKVHPVCSYVVKKFETGNYDDIKV